MDIEKIQQNLPAPAKYLGFRFTSMEKDRLVAEMEVGPPHCNPANIMHGGMIMTFADTMGAIGTWINIKEGQSTTTIESKTNFFSGVPVGMKLVAETVPLHRGRRTHVWETKLTRADGRLAAKVTQTQMVLEG